MHHMKPQEFTYVQDLNQPQLKDQTVMHLETTGQYPTAEPNVFGTTTLISSINVMQDEIILEKSIPLHSHSFIEIFFYYSGNNVGCLIGNHRYVLEKGDLVIIPAGVWHCTLRSSKSTEPCIRKMIILRKEYFLEICPTSFRSSLNTMETPYLLRLKDDKRKRIEAIYRLCEEEYQSKAPYWENIVSGCVQILFAEIMRTSEQANSINAQKDSIFEKSINYLNTHMGEKLTLAEMSQALFASERTISRIFQKIWV